LIGFVFFACPEPELKLPEQKLPALTGPLILQGNMLVGQWLEVNGLWGDFEWKRGDTTDAVNTVITSTNQRSYMLTQSDVGKYIAVTVTSPYRSGSVTSAVFGPVKTTTPEPEINVPGEGLDAKLAWLKTNAQNNTSYLVKVNKKEDLDGTPFNSNNGNNYLSYVGKNNITIWFEGFGGERTVSLASNGNLFTIEKGVMLVLDKDITLQGGITNNAPLVNVKGVLEMKDGSKITGNTSFSSSGGGVYVQNGTFTMIGGEISGNTSSYGGGVYVQSGTFTMSSGKITGNTSSSSLSSSYNGVYVQSGTFTMIGGEITGNTSFSSPSSSYSGVSVRSGTFTMNGGEISGYSGGGVSVQSGGTFTMNGGKISRNTSYSGGGVSVRSGTFTMNGGEISRNTSSCGGGVYVQSGTFTMIDGEIFGNISYLLVDPYYDYGGGGVFANGTYTKTGGIIYGYTAGDSKSNVVRNYDSGAVQNGLGHAVYYTSEKRRESTAGPTVNMNSSVVGSAGGWE
jgi:hypothetical protein